jgi:hypothetical protein
MTHLTSEYFDALETRDPEARERAALAALGCVRALEARGPERFRVVGDAWRALAAGAVGDTGGLLAVGGFAFAPDGGRAPHWAGYAAASLHVPEAAIARRGDEVRLTLTALATPDDTVEDLLVRLDRRAGELRLGRRKLAFESGDPAALAAKLTPAMPAACPGGKRTGQETEQQRAQDSEVNGQLQEPRQRPQSERHRRAVGCGKGRQRSRDE